MANPITKSLSDSAEFARYAVTTSTQRGRTGSIAATNAKQPPKNGGSAESNRLSGGTVPPGTLGYARTCNHCQQPYTAIRPKSRYCHPRCRVAAYRARKGGAK